MTATLYGSPVTDSPDDALTVGEAAALLGRPTNYVRSRIYSGELAAETDPVTRNYRLRRGDVEAFRDGRKVGDLSPMFLEIGGFEDEIAASRRRTDELIDQRNRAMVEWVDQRDADVVKVAEAARMGRQSAFRILRLTRAEMAAEAAQK